MDKVADALQFFCVRAPTCEESADRLPGVLSVDFPFVINASIRFWRAGRQEHSGVWTAPLSRMAAHNQPTILKTVEQQARPRFECYEDFAV